MSKSTIKLQSTGTSIRHSSWFGLNRPTEIVLSMKVSYFKIYFNEIFKSRFKEFFSPVFILFWQVRSSVQFKRIKSLNWHQSKYHFPFFFYLTMIWSLLYRTQYNIAALKPTPHLQTTLLWDQQLFLRSLWGALVNPSVHAVVMVCRQHNVWPLHSSFVISAGRPG